MAAPPYPKIENLYASLDGGEARAVGVLKRPARTGQIARWLCTEKIDGTNIRVSLEVYDGPSTSGPQLCEGYRVQFYGRTNKAQMPDFIQEYLGATFKVGDMQWLWQGRRGCVNCVGAGKVLMDTVVRCHCVEPYPITLYGEVYGAGIQGGGNYRRDGGVSFRLFDVLVAEKHWLTWESVAGVAECVHQDGAPAG
ncbi:hypothetical protein LCGC14_2848620, partial [marine sediment metagenome]